MVIFYKKWKKYNEIQLAENKMDLNVRKMTNHPPSPAYVFMQYRTLIIKAVVEEDYIRIYIFKADYPWEIEGSRRRII